MLFCVGFSNDWLKRSWLDSWGVFLDSVRVRHNSDAKKITFTIYLIAVHGL